MKRSLPFAIAAVLMSILACNLPSGAAGIDEDAFKTLVAETVTAASHPTEGPSATATSSPSATFTATQASPTATSKVVPCNLASFVQDVTVPDNTIMDPNELFTKTWRLKNVGTCTWTSGYDAVFDSGDQMGGPAEQQLTAGTVAPGQTIDLSIDMKAPGSAGTYKGNWKLREPGGVIFGLSTGPFWVQIKVGAGPVTLPDWPLRKVGDSGIEVFALQRLLITQGEELEADGIFGPVTKTKVQHFQGTHGLAADGIVGPLTWAKLIVQVQQGDHSPAVRAVQELLNAKGGYGLAVDGIFGNDTRTAVKDWQSDHGLASDGIVGPQTWRSLVGS